MSKKRKSTQKRNADTSPAKPAYSIDIYTVSGDMVLIDACIPKWVADRMLALLATI